jgi:hypothetical protein
MSVRVLRIMEIEYPDQTTYERDRKAWAVKDGESLPGGPQGPLYRQATMLPETIFYNQHEEKA